MSEQWSTEPDETPTGGGRSLGWLRPTLAIAALALVALWFINPLRSTQPRANPEQPTATGSTSAATPSTTGTAEEAPTRPGELPSEGPEAPASPAASPVESGPPSTAEPGTTVATPRVQPDQEWVTRTANATGIPPRAMEAYARATLITSHEQPSCGLGWNTVAAIGYVESNHAQEKGSVLDDQGRATPPIVGVPLNGNGVGRIPDTDGGALDGDTEWDRAVGPMQFIPSTWKSWGSDANGDGVADPQQIDDAALAAARYLCSAGEMSTPEGWRRAILQYNNVATYVDKVARVANQYAGASS